MANYTRFHFRSNDLDYPATIELFAKHNDNGELSTQNAFGIWRDEDNDEAFFYDPKLPEHAFSIGREKPQTVTDWLRTNFFQREREGLAPGAIIRWTYPGDGRSKSIEYLFEFIKIEIEF